LPLEPHDYTLKSALDFAQEILVRERRYKNLEEVMEICKSMREGASNKAIDSD